MRFHDYPRLLEEYYVQRLRETYRKRAEAVAAIQTAFDARRYVERARASIAEAFGPLPERSPLNARTWNSRAYSDYRIDGITFESRPGFVVTANLYLPTQRGEQVPGVLFPCGHYPEGKAGEAYVAACIRLAREGYAVLIYDPINQGEREVYSPPGADERLSRDNCCAGHNIIGRQLHACGDWFGTWRMWDGIRALDYLVMRPEVDADRLAITGQSGGGTLSAYIWAMDLRLRAVASNCWCTSYLNDLENSMPADDEQYPPGLLAAGLDKIDLFMSRAGAPTLLLGQEYDFFDDRGLRRGHDELQRLHLLLGGGPDTCALSMDIGTHAYSERNQLEMLAFFNRVFGRPAPAPQRPVPSHSESELQVTPDRDVCRVGSRSICEMVAEKAQGAADRRQQTAVGQALRELICGTLAVREPLHAPHYRRLLATSRARPCTGQTVHRFVVETEPGIMCVLRHVTRKGTPYRLEPGARALLYLPNVDSQQELESSGTMAGLDDFWVLDARGLGEGLLTLEDPYSLYGHDYMLTGHASLYGETMLGGRLTDVLATVRLLQAEGAQEVHLVGRKQGSVLALLAGAVDASVASVASREAPDSFLALATAPHTFWPAANFPRGILRAFDLPEVRDFLGTRLVEDTRFSSQAFAD